MASELDERFLAALDAHGLSRPLVNERAEADEGDCVWPAQRLIVELDSRGVHDRTRRFETDRVRDRRLQREGWRVIRVTWRQLHEDEGG